MAVQAPAQMSTFYTVFKVYKRTIPHGLPGQGEDDRQKLTDSMDLRLRTGSTEYEVCWCGKVFNSIKGIQIYQTRMRCSEIPSAAGDGQSSSSSNLICWCGIVFNSVKGIQIHQTRMKCYAMPPAAGDDQPSSSSSDFPAYAHRSGGSQPPSQTGESQGQVYLTTVPRQIQHTVKAKW